MWAENAQLHKSRSYHSYIPKTPITIPYAQQAVLVLQPKSLEPLAKHLHPNSWNVVYKQTESLFERWSFCRIRYQRISGGTWVTTSRASSASGLTKTKQAVSSPHVWTWQNQQGLPWPRCADIPVRRKWCRSSTVGSQSRCHMVDAPIVKGCKHIQSFICCLYWPILATVCQNQTHHCLAGLALCTQRNFTPLIKTGLKARQCGTGKINLISSVP